MSKAAPVKKSFLCVRVYGTFVCVHVRMCVCVYVCMCIGVYVCMCVYVDTSCRGACYLVLIVVT